MQGLLVRIIGCALLVAVLVRGTADWVDLKGDRFLRTTLGLRSTLVRMIPF